MGTALGDPLTQRIRTHAWRPRGLQISAMPSHVEQKGARPGRGASSLTDAKSGPSAPGVAVGSWELHFQRLRLTLQPDPSLKDSEPAWPQAGSAAASGGTPVQDSTLRPGGTLGRGPVSKVLRGKRAARATGTPKEASMCHPTFHPPPTLPGQCTQRVLPLPGMALGHQQAAACAYRTWDPGDAVRPSDRGSHC